MAVARDKQRKDEKKTKRQPTQDKEVPDTPSLSKAKPKSNSKPNKATSGKKPKPIPAYHAAKLARAAAATRASPDPLAGPVDLDLTEDPTPIPSVPTAVPTASNARRSTRSKASVKVSTPSSATSEEEQSHDINEVIWRQGGGDRLGAADLQESGMDASDGEGDSDEVTEVAPEVMKRILPSADEDDEDVEEASEQDDDDDDDDDEPVDIKFSVLTRGAYSTVDIPSSTSWTMFREEMAELTNSSLQELDLSFKYSTDAIKKPGERLNKLSFARMMVTATERLAEAAEAERKGKKGKNKGKEFSVTITDMNDGKKKKNMSGHGKKSAKNDLKRKRGDDDDDADPIFSDDSDSTLRKKLSKNKSPSQWLEHLREAETGNLCNQHQGKICIVGFQGKHIELRDEDENFWALLLSEGKWTDDKKPPPGIRAQDRNPDLEARYAAAKKKTATSSSDSDSDLLKTIVLAMASDRLASARPSSTTPASSTPSNPAQSTPAIDPSVLAKITEPDLFPRVSDWLLSLDQGPRGQDGHDFSQFSATLHTNKFIRISSLANETLVTPELLMRVCGESMVIGTATQLLTYARNDTRDIQEQELLRRKRIANEPVRYA